MVAGAADVNEVYNSELRTTLHHEVPTCGIVCQRKNLFHSVHSQGSSIRESVPEGSVTALLSNHRWYIIFTLDRAKLWTKSIENSF